MDFCLHLGHSPDGVPLYWDKASNNHISITGQSGQGKSYFLGRLIRQLPDQGVRCVIFDCSGDFRECISQTISQTDQLRLYSVREQMRIDPFRPMQWNQVYTESPEDVAARLSSMILSAYHFKGNAQPLYLRRALTEYLQCFSRPTFSGLVSRILEDETMAGKMAPTLFRLEELARLFPGGRGAEWQLDTPGISILQFDTIPDRAMQCLIVELLLSDLWGEALQPSTCHGQPPCPAVVVLDECQRFSFREDSMLTRILREGRKYHISGWFASQWLCDKQAVMALDQAALRPCFYPGGQNVRALCKRLCYDETHRRELEALIHSLGVGRFLYQPPGGGTILCCV